MQGCRLRPPRVGDPCEGSSWSMSAWQLAGALHVPAAHRALCFSSGLLHMGSPLAQKCSFYPGAICFPLLAGTRDGDRRSGGAIQEPRNFTHPPPECRGCCSFGGWKGAKAGASLVVEPTQHGERHPKAPSSPGAGRLLLPPG